MRIAGLCELILAQLEELGMARSNLERQKAIAPYTRARTVVNRETFSGENVGLLARMSSGIDDVGMASV